MLKRQKVVSGVPEWDDFLEGMVIGGNVIWCDAAGSLASVFCLRFMFYGHPCPRL
ncbi:hypothetical protein [Desulfosoma caldarium]|uniref:hypothetical protein n=1 Tax=Desulfosoma caldarium TaxID=610254 RepID=UPI00147611AE|nr:hypothetical protein [Desulfosoma caldarium]